MNTKININQLRGRIISEPCLTNVADDKQVLTFRFMYNTIQKTDNDGSHANFIQVEVWNKMAESMEPILYKGIEVLLNGSFVQKRYMSKEGNKVQIFIFSAENIIITDIYYTAKTQKAAEEAKQETKQETKQEAAQEEKQEAAQEAKQKKIKVS